MFALLASGASDKRVVTSLDLLGAYYAYNNNDGLWGNVSIHTRHVQFFSTIEWRFIADDKRLAFDDFKRPLIFL
jgi:hypothetical protein